MCGLNGHELELVRLVGFFMVSIKIVTLDCPVQVSCDQAKFDHVAKLLFFNIILVVTCSLSHCKHNLILIRKKNSYVVKSNTSLTCTQILVSERQCVALFHLASHVVIVKLLILLFPVFISMFCPYVTYIKPHAFWFLHFDSCIYYSRQQKGVGRVNVDKLQPELRCLFLITHPTHNIQQFST